MSQIRGQSWAESNVMSTGTWTEHSAYVEGLLVISTELSLDDDFFFTSWYRYGFQHETTRTKSDITRECNIPSYISVVAWIYFTLGHE